MMILMPGALTGALDIWSHWSPGPQMKCFEAPGASIFLSWSPEAPHIFDWNPGALNPFGTLLSQVKKKFSIFHCSLSLVWSLKKLGFLESILPVYTCSYIMFPAKYLYIRLLYHSIYDLNPLTSTTRPGIRTDRPANNMENSIQWP